MSGLLLAFALQIAAQCGNWNELAPTQKTEAEDAHVVYRPFVKDKTTDELAQMDKANFDIAFSNWKKAYTLAPAADGQRPSHYVDGRALHKAMIKRTDDEAKKKEYAQVVMRLYDEQMQCYQNEGYLLGRKGYDMLTAPGYGYTVETLETFQKGIEKAGNNTEYFILEPIGQLLAYLFQAKKIDREEVISVYERLVEIAEFNAENNQKYGQYYESSKARMDAQLQPVEDEVFDCTYFKNKFLPRVEENPEDLDVLRFVFNKLRSQGCDTTDADMARVKAMYEKVATEINTQLEGERRAKNPGYDAVQLQKEGQYEQAVARYREAIEKESDPASQAQYYYSIAFIQTWQFGQYQAARTNALKAAGLREGWGKPYMLIGDIYAKASRSCGDDWDSRLAILAAIEKYAYARSIDPSLADEASSRIANYSSAKPDRNEGFMRGITEGQKAKVGCWIGETVRVSFSN